jgi:hypothetical protein
MIINFAVNFYILKIKITKNISFLSLLFWYSNQILLQWLHAIIQYIYWFRFLSKEDEYKFYLINVKEPSQFNSLSC